eukprot:g5284.t1
MKISRRPSDFDGRMAKSLSKARKSGLASSRSVAGMAAFRKANLLDDEGSVIHQNVSVQTMFRVKVLLLFICQLSLMLGVMILCNRVPALRYPLDKAIGADDVRLFMFLAVGAALALIFCVKYMTPWSQILIFLWTPFAGIVFGVMNIHSQSNGMLQIASYTTLSVACLLPYSLMRFRRTVTSFQGMKKRSVRLISPLIAGIFSFLTVLIGAAVVNNFLAFSSWAHFVAANLVVIIIVLWVSYDLDLLAHKMEKSEWHQSIVFFYTDLLLLFSFCCVLCICCCMSGGDGMDGADGADGVDGMDGADAGGEVVADGDGAAAMEGGEAMQGDAGLQPAV